MKVRYVGDGSQYVIGRPALPDAIEDVDEETAAGLIDTGLYEPVEGTKPKKPKKDADGAAPQGGDA